MAGDAFFGEQAAPGAVGNDHQFGDEFVERAAALAFGNADAAGLRVDQITFDGEVVIVVALHRRRLAAPAFTGIGELPEGFQFVTKGKVG